MVSNLEKFCRKGIIIIFCPLQAISRHNPDKMKEYAAQAMPIAFLAMHEEEDGGDEGRATWEEVWNEGTPGTEGGIRLFLSEILALLEVAADSAQWRVKAQAARATGKIAQKLGGKSGQSF